MNKHTNNIWNKPLPRFFGVFVLLLSLGTIFWLSRNVVLFESKAAIGNTPKEVQVSNIRADSFTVSYTTDEAVTGSISYGKDPNLSEVAFDERDLSTPSPHTIHHITIKGLTPDTKYFFSIASGDGIFQNNSVPFETTTAKNSSPNDSKSVVKGRVVLESGEAPSEAIVYVQNNDSQLLSTLLKPDGSYSLNLDSLLKKDLSGPFSVSPDTAFNMNVLSSALKSKVSFFAESADPVPQVILSKDYDFTLAGGLASTATATESAQITGFPLAPAEEVSTDASILTPKNEEELKDQQPLFEGKAIPGSDVEIIINSSHEIITTVQTDKNGKWEFRPDTKLEPGEHTITIKTLSSEGILQTITRSFTVYAQGSQFTEPSISPTQKLSPIVITPTAAPTSAPTKAPTTAPSPTPTPVVIIPTSVITVPVTSPSPNITTPPIPASGSTALTIGIIGISIMMGIGGLLFILL